jgi:Putative peptidoglycan binding domain
MKTKFYWLALLASAAMIAQANAGGHHGGGGGGASGGSVAGSGPSNSGRSGAVASVRSMPMHTLSGGRMVSSGQRFSSASLRSASSTAFRPQYVSPRAQASIRSRQVARENISNSIARSSNGSRTISHVSRVRNGATQLKNGNATLRRDWHNHVFAQRSAHWQRNWDRRSDHFWHGHRCHFVNGAWIIFDLGFYPWDTFWYPDGNYYGYGYYSDPYGYDPGYYNSYGDQDEQYYGANNDDVTVRSADSIVANAQEELAQRGYYRDEIDGILGPETSRAIARFQSNQGLRVTGVLTRDTAEALGLRQVASTNGEPAYD